MIIELSIKGFVLVSCTRKSSNQNMVFDGTLMYDSSSVWGRHGGTLRSDSSSVWGRHGGTLRSDSSSVWGRRGHYHIVVVFPPPINLTTTILLIYC